MVVSAVIAKVGGVPRRHARRRSSAMPMSDGQVPLPFSGNNRISRHTSYLAAKAAAPSRASKSAIYLGWLRTVTSATDWGAADHLGWPLSSITSIRNGLVDRGLVEVAGITEGRYGKKVALWKVSAAST
jgi:hypothetical protein